MRAISVSHQRPNVTTAELRVPQVFHFVYACKLIELSQCCCLLHLVTLFYRGITKAIVAKISTRFPRSAWMYVTQWESYTGGVIGNGSKDLKRRKRNVYTEQQNDSGHDRVMYTNDIIIDFLPSETVVGYVGEDIEVYLLSAL